jgi:hypothetical protein
MTTATAERPATGPKKYRFKLLKGQYVSSRVIKRKIDGVDVQEIENTPYQADPRKGFFPIIETDIDLEVFNGPAPNMKKFERVLVDGPVQPVIENPLDRLPGETVHAYLTRINDLSAKIKEQTAQIIKALDTATPDQLVELAAQEEIDISMCKNPDDMRKVIRNALKS